MNRKITVDLFPALRDITGHADGLEYVAQRLDELAASGELYLTDLFNPPNRGRGSFYAGLIINGADYSENRIHEGARPLVPGTPLADYKVRLESISRDGKRLLPVSYKAGHKRASVRTGGGRTDTGENQFAVVEHDAVIGYPFGRDGTEGEIGVATAWTILSQCGENCASAPPKQLGKIWRVREVRPGADDEDAPKKKRRGRPAKKVTESTEVVF